MLNVPHREHHLFLHSKLQTGRSTCFEEIQEYLQGRALGVNYAENQWTDQFHTEIIPILQKTFYILLCIWCVSLTFSSELVKLAYWIELIII